MALCKRYRNSPLISLYLVEKHVPTKLRPRKEHIRSWVSSMLPVAQVCLCNSVVCSALVQRLMISAPGPSAYLTPSLPVSTAIPSTLSIMRFGSHTAQHVTLKLLLDLSLSHPPLSMLMHALSISAGLLSCGCQPTSLHSVFFFSILRKLQCKAIPLSQVLLQTSVITHKGI